MKPWMNVCLIILILVSFQSDLKGEELQKNTLSPSSKVESSDKSDITLYEAIQKNSALKSLGKAKSKPMAKVGSDLAILYEEYESYLQGNSGRNTGAAFKSGNSMMKVVDDRVIIDAVASGDVNALRDDLEAMGMQNIAVFGRFVSGQLPITAIDDIDALDSLKFARPAYAKTRVGLVTSQGDRAMNSNTARAVFGVDGTGITIGTLSDSFNCLGGAANNVANGDLPSGIVVLDDSACPDGIDEGRAMMQLIADVAPGASQAFHTAEGGLANFASGIVELATVAGADVIVDDIGYFFDSMFQDGIVAQAVNTVVGMGVAYFSAAGNDGRNSYESPFRPSGMTPITIGGIPVEAHDFNPGPGIDVFQQITVPEGTIFTISFQWDSPFFSVSGPPGSPNDLDVFILDEDLTTILPDITGNIVAEDNIGGDALELFTFFNPPGSGTTNFNIVITRFAGSNPRFMKYILFGFEGSIDEFDTASSTIFAHPNAAGAEAVGAAFFGQTPPFGTDPAILENFSSAGPTRIFFRTNGTRLPTPEIRQKPEIVAPDGTNTTFFGNDSVRDPDTFPNFFGTSAAAPHAAGVAALMLDRNPNLSPASIYTILENTADNMRTPGFDFDSGFGYIQANLAVQAVPLAPIRCNGLIATIIGTNGGDIINGTPARDIINGRTGIDRINGLAGNDIICGANGNDTLSGGDGMDMLLGGIGNDTLNGGNGNDRLNGEGGNDRLNGNAGGDILNGGLGNDMMNGGLNNDNCNGGPPASGDTAVGCETVINVP